jgi:hypothetical protein
MAVAAIDAETTNVVLVAEWNRLLEHDRLVGDVGRSHDPIRHPDGDERRHQNCDQHHARDRSA